MNRTKGFAGVTIVVIVGVLAIAGGVYYFFFHHAGEQAQRSPEEIQAELEEKKLALQIESAKLADLEREKRTKQAANADVRTWFLAVSGKVRMADALFNNPTTNAKIKVKAKTPQIEADINKKRKQLEADLKALEEALSKSLIPDPALIAKAKEVAKELESYFKALENIVDNLTPADSGLTKTQIENYQDVVDDASEQTNTATEHFNNPPPPNQGTQQQASNQQNNQGQNPTNPNQPQSPNNPGAPQPDPEVIAQQEKVKELEKEIEDLEEELEDATQPQTPSNPTPSNQDQTPSNPSSNNQPSNDPSPAPEEDVTPVDTSGRPQRVQGW